MHLHGNKNTLTVKCDACTIEADKWPYISVDG